MKRRDILFGIAGTVLFGGAAFAQSFSDSIVSQLRQRGFQSISVERTMLGRTRIVAIGNGGRREIILNPRTGEILRDLWVTGGSDGDFGSNSGSSGGGLIEDDDDSGRGRGRGRGGSDTDEEEDDNDNSGSSGSGGDSDDDDDDSDED